MSDTPYFIPSLLSDSFFFGFLGRPITGILLTVIQLIGLKKKAKNEVQELLRGRNLDEHHAIYLTRGANCNQSQERYRTTALKHWRQVHSDVSSARTSQPLEAV